VVGASDDIVFEDESLMHRRSEVGTNIFDGEVFTVDKKKSCWPFSNDDGEPLVLRHVTDLCNFFEIFQLIHRSALRFLEHGTHSETQRVEANEAFRILLVVDLILFKGRQVRVVERVL